MRLHASRREISVKIVYYGPGLSGKTSNLVFLHRAYPPLQRGALLQLDTETERTLFFDYFPISMGDIGGYRVKVDFFTVPGQSFYHATRRAVLEGADGLVFVADSSPDREEANLVSREDMLRNLEACGRSLTTLPHIYQWNKRDLEDALPVSVMEKLLNPEGARSVPATATQGDGVWETQVQILREVFDQLRAQTQSGRRHA